MVTILLVTTLLLSAGIVEAIKSLKKARKPDVFYSPVVGVTMCDGGEEIKKEKI